MNDIVLFGEGILSKSLYVVRSQVPLISLGHVLSTDKILVISYRHEDGILAFPLTIVDGRLVLQFDFVLVVVGADPLHYVLLIGLLPDHFPLLLYALVNGGHQQPRNLQGVRRCLKLVDVGQI